MISTVGKLLEERLPKEFYDCDISTFMSNNILEVARISFPVECLGNIKFDMDVILRLDDNNTIVRTVMPHIYSLDQSNRISALQIINAANISCNGELCFVLTDDNRVQIISEFYAKNGLPEEIYQSIRDYVILFSPKFEQSLQFIMQLKSLN